MIDLIETHKANLTKRVLDKGSISLIDMTPRIVEDSADFAIAEAARTSIGRGLKTPEEDIQLIRRLYQDKHTSPFEMVEFKFKVVLPIFVARQWVRHRTANINEVSGRYSELKERFYFPHVEEIRIQSATNKQVSEGILGSEKAEKFCTRVQQLSDLAYSYYKDAIKEGIPREQARILLPLNLYTEWIWKNDLHNVLNFLRLRLAPDAQTEIRVYAEAMAEILRVVIPHTMEIFDESRT